jgi:hypothetical protein
MKRRGFFATLAALAVTPLAGRSIRAKESSAYGKVAMHDRYGLLSAPVWNEAICQADYEVKALAIWDPREKCWVLHTLSVSRQEHNDPN